MTKLLIDIGNSRCKYACVEDHCIKMHGAFAVEQIAKLSDVVRECGSAIAKMSYIMSVASQSVNNSVADVVVRQLGHQPIFLEKKMPLCGLSSEYNASQLGIDRIAVMIASWHRLKRACIVIDCGTAATIDFIDNQGVHKGGVILPSDELMRFSLSEATAQLDYFNDRNKADDIFATNTEEAIVCGCRLTLVGALTSIVEKMRKQYQTDIPVVVTGGIVHSLENDSNFRLINHLSFIPTLNFEGMMILIDGEYT